MPNTENRQVVEHDRAARTARVFGGASGAVTLVCVGIAVSLPHSAPTVSKRRRWHGGVRVRRLPAYQLLSTAA